MGMKFVVLVVIVLAVIAIAQIMRVYELSTKIRGKREEDVNLRVNNINASLMLIFMIVFFASFFWMLAAYGRGMLPNAASEIGVEIDWLYNVNWWIVVAVFLLTNGLLFGFAWKYAYDPNRRAHWFPHDNKLEMIWTIVPAAVLAVIIILGLLTWGDITGEPSDDAQVVELYAKQFGFKARYAGDDNKLGYADYKLIGSFTDTVAKTSYSNPLGVVSNNSIMWRVHGINAEIDDLKIAMAADSSGVKIFSVAAMAKMLADVEKLERIRERVLDMSGSYEGPELAYAEDDFIATELFLVKDQEYFFVLRSEDVLHSAYFPHFRAQMNCVPGQRTTLKVKPIYTTAEMREMQDDPYFNYILLCNKICGVSHSMMNMAVTVGTQEEYEEWKITEGNTSMAIADTLLHPASIDTARMEMPKAIEHGHGDHDEAHDGDDHEGGEEADHGDHR